MKPRALCTRMDPKLFETYEDRFVAAAFCVQCPMQDRCLSDAMKERVTEQVRGGMWIGKSGRPEQIRLGLPPPTEADGVRPDEYGLEQRLLHRYGDWDVPTRHEVWLIGEKCQQASRRSGAPCDDYICKTIRAGQARHRRWRQDENPRQHVVPVPDQDVRDDRLRDGRSGTGGWLPTLVPSEVRGLQDQGA